MRLLPVLEGQGGIVVNRLIFADTETTGLKPGHVLELALVAVELPTFKEVARFSTVVVPSMWPSVKRNLHERVTEMHTKSGLMAELDAIHAEHGCTTPAAEREAIAFMQEWAPKTMSWHTPMAGANPAFDRMFIEADMKTLAARFHYRHFEVRTITLLQEWVFGIDFQESPHRALPDCRKAIQDVRTFLGLG